MVTLSAKLEDGQTKYLYKPSVKSEPIGIFYFKETDEKIEIWGFRIYVRH